MKPFTTNRLLYLTILPSAFVFSAYTHLVGITRRRFGTITSTNELSTSWPRRCSSIDACHIAASGCAIASA
jgi:hypothetical protein